MYHAISIFFGYFRLLEYRFQFRFGYENKQRFRVLFVRYIFADEIYHTIWIMLKKRFLAIHQLW
jgi:hypothetical protein